ncbi:MULTISPECIES: hypothetical protein [unclassified Streptomyces]|uniref:hypothetical protein n=1 Tax=unclassified Streptomyces TaxID=2593676 RepID=UPI002E1475E8|nr:hypothetical protein OG452_23475 [Streptomyces sp. NBC_01197]WSS49265.1 hypothetical protein OG708_11825 [Streptomyces sp. NBC_01180]
MSTATSTRTQTESGELWASGGPLELHTVPLDPKVIAELAEVRVPTPRSVLIGWVDVPPGDPRGATNHALYLTPGGYAYRVTTYLDGRRINGANSN